MARLLDAPDASGALATSARWLRSQPTQHAGYQALLEETPAVWEAMFALPDETHTIVRTHIRRTVFGMQGILERAASDGTVVLQSLEELRQYCYVVAGIVGELLTAVFIHHAPRLSEVAPVLVEHQVAFGEGLQLVNILKDAGDDAREGRTFLPAGVPRADVIALARRDLDRADAYNAALVRGGAPPGFVAFTSLPAELARRNLDLLEKQGAGAKVPRKEVMQIYARYLAAASSASAQIGK
jgi:farnesyl-diphosphate farnesyltransferase